MGRLEGRNHVPALSPEYATAITHRIEEIQLSLAPIADNVDHQNQMVECFIGLAALFPIQDIGEHGFSIKHSILNQIFSEYPLQHLKQACVDYARTGEWFPRPKELIERIEKLMSSDQLKLCRLQELKDKMHG